MSIRARLLWLTIGLIVPLVLVGFYNVWSAWQASRQQLSVSVARQAELAATAFEQWLAAQRQTLLTIKDLSENNQNSVTLKDYLNSIVKTRPQWLDVQIVGAAGDVKLSQSTKDQPLPLVSIETLRNEVADKKSFVVLTEQLNAGELRLLSLAMPIAGGDFVVARIDGGSASLVFEQLDLPPDHIIAVFDGSNRLLYRNRVSPEQMSLDVSNTPLLSALNNKSIAAVEIESPYDEIERVYGLARVEVANSVVAVGVPSANLYETAQRQFFSQLFFGLLTALLAVIAALLVTRSIVTPLQILGEAARSFGAGDLRARADVTESAVTRKLGLTFNQMANQIAEREETLKNLDRLKSDFVSGVSHELRTPLTTIKTLTHVLQQSQISPEERREFLETIAVECDRQIDFVQNLLDLSRIEAGAYNLNLAATDAIKIIKTCAESQKHAANARGLRLKFIEPDENPPPVMTDKNALHRIISSLLENSVKYTPEGGEIIISAASDNQNSRVEIKISDTGCGIAGEDLPHIFDKFYRGNPLALAGDDDGTILNEKSGVGLGLYLVRSLTEQIGAEISVKSPPDGKLSGTEFTVFLPAA